MARKVVSHAGAQPTALLAAVDQLIAKLPRVTGSNAQQARLPACTVWMCSFLNTTGCATDASIWQPVPIFNDPAEHAFQRSTHQYPRLFQGANVLSAFHYLCLYLQTIGTALVGVLQSAKQLQSSWGDDFVSVEHLLQAVTQVCTHCTSMLEIPRNA